MRRLINYNPNKNWKVKGEHRYRSEIQALMVEFPDLKAILLKEGSKGSSCYLRVNSLQEEGQFDIKYFSQSAMKDPTLERKVVDTTGAGDAFTGAFAVRYTETKGDISDSLKFASAMGFCAVSKFGCGKNCVASREEISEILDMNTRRTSFN